MQPLLHPGDIVRIERRETIHRGDVVAVEIAGVPAIHRVARVSGHGVVCVGDNCRRPDPEAPLSAVYGVATVLTPGRRLRGGRSGYLFARARYFGAVVPLMARTAGDEVDLLFRQVTALRLPERRLFAGGPRVARDEGFVLLDPAAAIAALAGAVPPGDGIEVPAGVFGGMSGSDREKLLDALSGRRVVVWGTLARRPRLRVTRPLRRALAAAGLSAGRAGDASVRGPREGWRLFHYVEPEELADALRAAGGADVEAVVVQTIGGGSYVRGSAQL
jgi:hypothetical protein